MALSGWKSHLAYDPDQLILWLPVIGGGESIMRRRVKGFIEISDYTSLDRLITTLAALRDSLPAEAEPELKMRGDDVFGRRLTISYFRELTPEEAECEARYAAQALPEPDPRIDELCQSLESVPFRRRRTDHEASRAA